MYPEMMQAARINATENKNSRVLYNDRLTTLHSHSTHTPLTLILTNTIKLVWTIFNCTFTSAAQFFPLIHPTTRNPASAIIKIIALPPLIQASLNAGPLTVRAVANGLMNSSVVFPPAFAKGLTNSSA